MPQLDHTNHAAQAIIAGFEGLHVPDTYMQLIAQGSLGGLIFFKRNIESLEHIYNELHRVHAWCQQHGVPVPLLSVDQEGGRVERLRDAPFVSLPAMQTLAKSGVAAIEQASYIQAQQLRYLGFNLNFAPVLDIDTNPDNPIIGDRAFGHTPSDVIEHASAFIRGHQRAGLLTCGKHFPGHGDTISDSHLCLPQLRHSLERLENIELAPFKALHHQCPMLMTAHIVMHGLDPDAPATLSPRIITQLLRQEIGYEGVIVSDDLEMQAISDNYSVPEAAAMAIEAGCDALLICRQEQLVLESIETLATRAPQDITFAKCLAEATRRMQAMREARHTYRNSESYQAERLTYLASSIEV